MLTDCSFTIRLFDKPTRSYKHIHIHVHIASTIHFETPPRGIPSVPNFAQLGFQKGKNNKTSSRFSASVHPRTLKLSPVHSSAPSTIKSSLEARLILAPKSHGVIHNRPLHLDLHTRSHTRPALRDQHLLRRTATRARHTLNRDSQRSFPDLIHTKRRVMVGDQLVRGGDSRR